jgi:hypothetical protein
VGRHIRQPHPRWEIGIVPHGHHRAHEGLRQLAAAGEGRVRVVNIHQSAAAAVREIAACSVIFTTSLHGLITADSFGIPAAWASLEPALTGGDFKFRDYEAVITPESTRSLDFGEALTLDDVIRATRRADAGVVARVSDDLERALGTISAALPRLPPFPRGVGSVLRS